MKTKIEGKEVFAELDGPRHGDGYGLTETKQTRERNEDYIKTHTIWIQVNEELCAKHNVKPEAYLAIRCQEEASKIRAKSRLTI